MTATGDRLETLLGSDFARLQRADQVWHDFRQPIDPAQIPTAFQPRSGQLPGVDWDIVICGGTLGILLGAALVQRGWRVALLERGELRGRDQEWNISRAELQVLVDLDLVTEAELAAAIASEFNPVRIQFHQGDPVWVRDVLNIGVSPVQLLETVKQTFRRHGGTLLEHHSFHQADIYDNGVEIHSQARDSDTPQTLTSRLLLDGMGHFSPIVRQVRAGRKPDSVCLVVGTCAQGYPVNNSGDLMVSFTPIHNQCQYFWEAFPAASGRTTYLFTYVDADPRRLSLQDLFADYWDLLPSYQDIELEQLTPVRSLFGFFPCYRDNPLRAPSDRLLPIGDSSGSQSPLSFGGFGAMLRHLDRLTTGISEALQTDGLDHASLSLLQPYQPNLSVTWLFQKTMSVPLGQTLPPNQINELLSSVFAEMAALGDDVLQPFLQDVVQWGGLSQTLLRASVSHPLTITKILPQVGLEPLLDWTQHYASLSTYTALSAIAPSLQTWIDRLPPAKRYRWRRWQDAWRYGAGLD